MGIFDFLSQSAPKKKSNFPPLGSGRKLRSELSVDEALKVLGSVLGSYRTPKYKHLPHYVEASWIWLNSEQEEPRIVVALDNNKNEMLIVALWDVPGGSEIGVFPLGSGDERLEKLDLIDDWKQRDSSLSPVGLYPQSSISLDVPKVPENYLEETLKIAGYPATPRNIDALGRVIGSMVLIKAYEFVSHKNPNHGQYFVQNHQYNGGDYGKFYKQVLTDLAAYDPYMLPFIQEMLIRIKAIVLDGPDEAETWKDFER